MINEYTVPDFRKLLQVLKIITAGVAVLLSGCGINEPFVRTYNIDISKPSMS